MVCGVVVASHLVQDHDLICPRDGREPVRNHQRGAPSHRVLQCLLYLCCCTLDPSISNAQAHKLHRLIQSSEPQRLGGSSYIYIQEGTGKRYFSLRRAVQRRGRLVKQ